MAPERPDRTHRYHASVTWSGSTAGGYREYDRGHDAGTDPATVPLRLSADPAFRGDPALLNPEQLLVLSASSCQLLSFLAVAARAGLDVVGYTDDAEGEMPHDPRRPSWIERIVLRPTVTVRAPDGGDVDEDQVRRLLEQAHDECYIATTIRSAVTIEPTVVIA